MGKLIPLRLKPGIDREYTSFTNEGGWRDCDKVRFRQGFPEVINGWQQLDTDTNFQGIIRHLYSYGTLSVDQVIGVGTHLKYYTYYQGDETDITPIRETRTGAVTFSATNGDATITCTSTSHGAVANDFVTFSGAVSLGGNITADVLNQEYQISIIIDNDTFEIEAKDTDGNEVLANASDTGNGGGGVTEEFQINTGLRDVAVGSGWGVGPFGASTWGTPRALPLFVSQLRLWSSDNFGEDLVINVRDGGIYYWDVTTPSTRAVALNTLSGASDVPTLATSIITSDQDRHLIAFGADPLNDSGNQDPLLVRWSDQENAADWTPTTTNTAGDLRLSSGSFIVGAVQTKREILIFTDKSVHSMQFLGPPYIFGIQEVGRSGRAVSPNAIVSVDDVVFWMENGRFMMYDGAIREIPCRVKEFVFATGREQLAKTCAGHNPRYSEVWWWYPTGEDGSNPAENDRYVVYNYAQDIWYIGSMPRTAWIINPFGDNPIAASPDDSRLYYHEIGNVDGSQVPGLPIAGYIESSPIDMEDGDNFVFLQRVIPDLTFRNTSVDNAMVTMTFKAHEFPGASFDQEDAEEVLQSASTPVEQYTNQVFIRLRGRAFTMRVENTDTAIQWRLGTPRVEIRPDGKR